jgi:hypothetical protein
MELRSRDSEKIKNDALALAAKKSAAGCAGCAEQYLDLARLHGASPGEVASTRTGRRILLPAGATLGALTGAGTAGLVRARAAAPTTRRPIHLSPQDIARYRRFGVPLPRDDEPLVQDPFGVDSSTSSGCGTTEGMPLNFYIGELGIGTSQTTAAFDIATAEYVGREYTYGYLVLEGPGTRTGTAAYDWGVIQGNALATFWDDGKFAKYTSGMTLFADIEPGFSKAAGTIANNALVLNGFLHAIVNNDLGYTLGPGVYCSPADITALFGSSTFSYPFVFWVTGEQTCAPCSPCSKTCDTITDVENRWSTTIKHACFAGNGAALWQYWIYPSCGCCGDFDYTPQSPYHNFIAVKCS